MLQSVDHEEHKRRRAPLNPFFSKAIVANRQDMIHGFANKLCDRIAQFEGSTVNITAAVSAFTRDVAMQFVLSKDYRNLDNENFGVEMTNVLRKQHSSPSTLSPPSIIQHSRVLFRRLTLQRELRGDLACHEACPIPWAAHEIASAGLGRKGRRCWDQSLFWISESESDRVNTLHCQFTKGRNVGLFANYQRHRGRTGRQGWRW